jgi:hypothetical protein
MRFLGLTLSWYFNLCTPSFAKTLCLLLIDIDRSEMVVFFIALELTNMIIFRNDFNFLTVIIILILNERTEWYVFPFFCLLSLMIMSYNQRTFLISGLQTR